MQIEGEQHFLNFNVGTDTCGTFLNAHSESAGQEQGL